MLQRNNTSNGINGEGIKKGKKTMPTKDAVKSNFLYSSILLSHSQRGVYILYIYIEREIDR